MKIIFDPSDFEPLVTQIVRECLRQLRPPTPCECHNAASQRDDHALTIREAAKYIGVCERTLRKLMKDGEIEFFDAGNGSKKAMPRFRRTILDGFTKRRASTDQNDKTNQSKEK